MTPSRVLTLVIVLGAIAWLVLRSSETVEPTKTTTRPSSARQDAANDENRRPPGATDTTVRTPTIVPREVKVDETSTVEGQVQFSGRVVSAASGDGIDAAELTFTEGPSTHSIVTGVDGRFTFDVPDLGVYQLAAVTADGYVPFSPAWGGSPLTLTARQGRQVNDLIITLAPKHELIGRVVDTDGEPQPDATVKLYTAAGPLLRLAEVAQPNLDSTAQFKFTATAGTLVEATHPVHAPYVVRLTEKHIKSGRLTLRVGDLQADKMDAVIAGVVRDENGTPLPDATVSAEQERVDRFREQPDFRMTQTDVEGRFLLERLTASTYTLSASCPEHAPTKVEEIRAGSEDVEIQLQRQGGWIAGQVTATDPSGPVPSFVVVVSKPIGRIQDVPEITRSFIDPEGRYKIGPIAANTYLVRVIANRFATSKPQNANVFNGATESVDVKLSPGAELTGVVLNGETKAPIADARVELESRALGEGLPVRIAKSTQTGADGRFSLGGIPSGLFSVRGSADGFNHRAVSGLQATEGQVTGPVEVVLSPLEDPNEAPKTELAGIGAALAPDGDTVRVGIVLENGGAAEAGIQPGDRILGVDGQPVVDLDFNGVIQRIRGPVDSTVTLEVQTKRGQKKTLVVPRRAIKN